MKNERHLVSALHTSIGKLQDSLRSFLNTEAESIDLQAENNAITVYNIIAQIFDGEVDKPDSPQIFDDKTIQQLKSLFDHYQDKQRFERIFLKTYDLLWKGPIKNDGLIDAAIIIAKEVVDKLKELEK